MKQAPNCYVIHDAENHKMTVVSAKRKKEILKIILKSLDGLKTSLTIDSAYMAEPEEETQRKDNVTFL